MSAIKTIEKVLAAQVLVPELMIVPDRGATELEIAEEERALCRKLRPEHAAVLKRWNGIGLDVIRLFGCGGATVEVGRLAELQLRVEFPIEGAIVLGSDAAGFAYVQAADGRLCSFDTDGGLFKPLALNLDDFIDRLVFGPDAATFAGDDWRHKLEDAGLI